MGNEVGRPHGQGRDRKKMPAAFEQDGFGAESVFGARRGLQRGAQLEGQGVTGPRGGILSSDEGRQETDLHGDRRRTEAVVDSRHGGAALADAEVGVAAASKGAVAG